LAGQLGDGRAINLFEVVNDQKRWAVQLKGAGEEFLGYDFIGIECDGSFHSFYCHDITNNLVDKFSLNLNSYGLLEKLEKPNEIREYLNSEKTGLEPVPWYIVKVKRQKDSRK